MVLGSVILEVMQPALPSFLTFYLNFFLYFEIMVKNTYKHDIKCAVMKTCKKKLWKNL